MVASAESQRAVRLLMALWDGALTKGKLIEKVKKSGEAAKDYHPIIEQLIQDKALALSGEKRSTKVMLLEAGKQLLGELLRDPKFQFGGQIGKSAANVLLAVMRSQAAAPTTSSTKVELINSYEAFKTVALETFDRLNQDFNMDNLVPIYRIRREIGAQVSRKDFDSWLLELQATDIFQLLEGSVEDSAPDKIEDSITTKVSGLRCYAKRLEA
jgi:hypothetical protein